LTNAIEQSDQAWYPAGLLDWAGHRKGGVRKPFDSDTGRPLGKQIETKLVQQMNNWLDDLIQNGLNKDTPRFIMLVGGPGNGKSDAIDGCISQFDHKLSARGELIRNFTKAFTSDQNSLPPRRVEVSIGDNSCGKLPKDLQIWLVQDATESGNNNSPEAALLEEVTTVADSSDNIIYICCVNRGILSQVSSLAHKNSTPDVVDLIEEIVSASSIGINLDPCWPLPKNHKFAIWPMDEESLVNTDNGGKSVAHQIFEAALDKQKWPEKCVADEFCPFCENRRQLSIPNQLDSLIEILANYELISGKKWTFRDLFSMVPHILVGEGSEFKAEKDRNMINPCQWAADLLKDSHIKKSETYVLNTLVSRLYHHRLFSKWPALRSKTHREAKNKILNKSQLDKVVEKDGRHIAYEHFNFLAYRRPAQFSSITSILLSDHFSTLDAGSASGYSEYKPDLNAVICDERFSLSIDDGLSEVHKSLSTLEIKLLKQLAKADNDLSPSLFDKSKHKHARLLQSSLRKFASILSKRSLGVRSGICADHDIFSAYKTIGQNKDSKKKIVRQFSALINKEDRFRAGLATTYGQPVTNNRRDIALYTKKIKLSYPNLDQIADRPGNLLPFLELNDLKIPVTFQLYKSLNGVASGMMEASLPEEVYAMIDGIKSRIAGRIIRDPNILEDELFLLIGKNRVNIEIDNHEIETEWVGD
jgi:hypothetical protein